MSRKLGIWGSYNHGNYGDDIMALAIADRAKQMGFDVDIFRISHSVISDLPYTSQHCVDTLVSECDYLVIGGGAWLNSGDFSDNVEQDCVDFLSALKRHNKTFISISIGGDNCADIRELSKARVALFSSENYLGGTVRLKSDEAMLTKIHKPVTYCQDIVLGIAEDYRMRLGDSPCGLSKTRIGLNLNRTQRRFGQLCQIIARLRGMECVFIKSHLQSHDLGFELNPVTSSGNEFTLTYANAEDFIHGLSKLDVLISFKLHLGVTCLGLNVPFISFGGSGKTQAFMNEFGLAKFIYDNSQKVQLLLCLLFAPKSLLYSFEEEKMTRQKTDAESHFSFLAHYINDPVAIIE